MDFKKIYSFIKNNLVNIILTGFVLVVLFNPDAKSWMLQQLVKVGLFNAEIKKEGLKDVPENISFSFINSEGKMLNTAELKGKVVFINFWASWCPPCRAEMPSIQALYNKLKADDRIVFLFMNEDEDETKATNYLKKNNYTIPFYKPFGVIPDAIFSGSLPTTVVLDKNGKMVLKHQGMAGYDSDGFMKQLMELL